MSRATMIDPHLEEERQCGKHSKTKPKRLRAEAVEQTQDAVETDTDDDIPEQYRVNL